MKAIAEFKHWDTIAAFVAVVVSIWAAFYSYSSTADLQSEQQKFELRLLRTQTLEPRMVAIADNAAELNGIMNAALFVNRQISDEDLQNIARLSAEIRQHYRAIQYWLPEEAKVQIDQRFERLEAMYLQTKTASSLIDFASIAVEIDELVEAAYRESILEIRGD